MRSCFRRDFIDTFSLAEYIITYCIGLGCNVCTVVGGFLQDLGIAGVIAGVYQVIRVNVVALRCAADFGPCMLFDADTGGVVLVLDYRICCAAVGGFCQAGKAALQVIRMRLGSSVTAVDGCLGLE